MPMVMGELVGQSRERARVDAGGALLSVRRRGCCEDGCTGEATGWVVAAGRAGATLLRAGRTM